eukprot:8298556-Pyramimonas_sp.AAC.1
MHRFSREDQTSFHSSAVDTAMSMLDASPTNFETMLALNSNCSTPSAKMETSFCSAASLARMFNKLILASLNKASVYNVLRHCMLRSRASDPTFSVSFRIKGP